MNGWAGPLLIFGDLVLLGLALFAIFGIVGLLFWLVLHLWFCLVLAGALVLVALGWGYWHYRVNWGVGETIATCWRSELSQPHGLGEIGAKLSQAREPEKIGYMVVPVAVYPRFCDGCGSPLINGACQMCMSES